MLGLRHFIEEGIERIRVELYRAGWRLARGEIPKRGRVGHASHNLWPNQEFFPNKFLVGTIKIGHLFLDLAP